MSWKPLRQPPAEKDPAPLSRSLDRLSQSLGAPSAEVLRVVFASWDDLVGAALAAHARPLSIRDGALVVVVDHPSWATEVRWLGPELLARLTEAAGEQVAGRIEVRVGPGALGSS
ncbi:MAG: DciA family protein [Acidimicrobiales bacterium]